LLLVVVAAVLAERAAAKVVFGVATGLSRVAAGCPYAITGRCQFFYCRLDLSNQRRWHWQNNGLDLRFGFARHGSTLAPIVATLGLAIGLGIRN